MTDVAQTEKHWHWDFLAHDGEAGQIGDIHWGVGVTVIGYLCEADARLAAEDIVTRKTYVLRRVWECPACGYQGQVIQAMQNLVEKA